MGNHGRYLFGGIAGGGLLVCLQFNSQIRKSVMSKCPFCAEEIQPKAIKCKHCQSDLFAHKEKEKQESTLSNIPPTQPSIKKIVIGVLILLSPIIFLYWYVTLPTAILIFIFTRKKWSNKQKLITTFI